MTPARIPVTLQVNRATHALMRLEGQRIAVVRLVLSGVAAIPWRATAAEQVLTGADISPTRIEQAAEQALPTPHRCATTPTKFPLRNV